MMKTKAAVLYHLHHPLIIDELEIPILAEGQVLVKILYSGLCHSQLNEIKGLRGDDKYLPHLLGHEGSGTVEEIGPGVSKVKPGDYVVLSWIKGKGKEAPSSNYRKGEKIINSGAISTLATYSIISENRVFRIPPGIKPDVAALLGCAIPTGAGIIKNNIQHHLNGRISSDGQHCRKKESIVIFGIGGIGASALVYASSQEYQKIIAVDIHDAKLNFAERIGATHTINASQEQSLEKIREITGNEGADFSIECSGARLAMESAFQCLKNSGCAIIAGNLKKGEKISIDPFDLIKGKKIIGTWGGGTDPDVDILHYTEKILSNKLNFEVLISKRYLLDEINEAIGDLENGRVIRALIQCQA